MHSTSSYQPVIQAFRPLQVSPHQTRSNKCSSKDLSGFLPDLPKCNGVRNPWDINAMQISWVYDLCIFCNHWAIQSDDISFHMRYTLDMRACLQGYIDHMLRLLKHELVLLAETFRHFKSAMF